MARQKRAGKKAKRTPRNQQQDPASAAGPQHKKWTLLVYLCGDTELLEGYVDSDFQEICRVGSLPDIHVVVQRDRSDGALRYVLPENPGDKEPEPDPNFRKARVNTGDPKEAIDFFRWGIERAPSDHVALIFSGLGINPQYVRQYLSLRGKREGEDERSSEEERVYGELFSVCLDETDRDVLQTTELRQILQHVADELAKRISRRTRRVDLIGLDMGAAAFAEIAYQFDTLAEVFVASQRPLPDDGWPYDTILQNWQKSLEEDEKADAKRLGATIVRAVADAYPDPKLDVRIAAINLRALQKATRVLDTLALALMHNLGDWHVLNAVRQAFQKTPRVSAWVPDESTDAQDAVNLPTGDMLGFLEQLLQEFEACDDVPEKFGQAQRLAHLKGLTTEAITALEPQEETGENNANESPPAPTTTRAGRLFVETWPTPRRGLSLMMPNVSKPNVTSEPQASPLNVAQSNYLNLRFSQQVHWAAFVGAFFLINDKPHTLWRMISTMLAGASSSARDQLLQQLTGSNSALGSLNRQFQSLLDEVALTLSLDPIGAPVSRTQQQVIRLRLESALDTATVDQHDSHVYLPTIEAALKELEELFNRVDDQQGFHERLLTLGRTLGEDVLQDMAERIEDARKDARGGGESSARDGSRVSGKPLEGDDSPSRDDRCVPHLRLQIPLGLMRYPWEIMQDRQGMLCTQFALGRQVFAETPKRAKPRRPGPIRVLVIGDPQFTPEFVERYEADFEVRLVQLQMAQNEARAVVGEFERLKKVLAGWPEIQVDPHIATELKLFDFREMLRSGRYDIIHYAGHAQFDHEDPENSAWILSDSLLRAREIRNTLAWLDTPPWLVYANACEAGMDQALGSQKDGLTTPPGRYQGDVFGLATAFILQGVAAYIAPLWPIDDLVSARQAVRFYGGLLEDRVSLGEALYRGKVATQKELFPDEDEHEAPVTNSPRIGLSWASMVLYGDPVPKLLDSLWTP